MGAQTSYELEHTAGVEGAPVDGQLRNIISKSAEVAIPFGRVVVAGTGANQCRLPTGGGDLANVLGISVRVQNRVPAATDDVLQYEIGDEVAIMDFGEIWMIPETNVTAFAQAFIRFTAGVGEELGRVRSDTDGGDAAALGLSLIFAEAGTAATPVRTRFRKTA